MLVSGAAMNDLGQCVVEPRQSVTTEQFGGAALAGSPISDVLPDLAAGAPYVRAFVNTDPMSIVKRVVEYVQTGLDIGSGGQIASGWRSFRIA
jgi:hypothetical protein